MDLNETLYNKCMLQWKAKEVIYISTDQSALDHSEVTTFQDQIIIVPLPG